MQWFMLHYNIILLQILSYNLESVTDYHLQIIYPEMLTVYAASPIIV